MNMQNTEIETIPVHIYLQSTLNEYYKTTQKRKKECLKQEELNNQIKEILINEFHIDKDRIYAYCDNWELSRDTPFTQEEINTIQKALKNTNYKITYELSIGKE